MAFKKRLPSSHSDYDNYDDNQFRSSQNQGFSSSGPKENIFSDTFDLKVDYKPDQVFDFDDYKHKIVNIMEVFREDVLNLKSNLMHLFTIADKQVHKDYHDLTNELVALSQIKLEVAVSKSSAYLKNFDEETLSRKILNKLTVDDLRQSIRSQLYHFKDEIESYLTEDKFYRKSTFALSDLALQLEKVFKVYDILNEEGGLFNYVKIDEITLYDQVFKNNLEIDFDILIHLNVPLIKDRLKAENMYRTGAATTKERLMFRIGEICDKDPADYSLTSITSYIKTLLLREKFNLKHNLSASFQKNLPKGLELQGDSDRLRKEIKEELDALKESIAYLESQNKSYIKIITGNYNPEFIQSMSHTITNIDILIDIERLFTIIQDVTERIRSLLSKVRQFNQTESQDVSQSVEHALNLVLSGLSQAADGKFDLNPIIDETFATIHRLIEEEKAGRERFQVEKQKIDQERKELESYVDNLAVTSKQTREASATKPAESSALKFQKEDNWKVKDESRDTHKARRELEESKRDTVGRETSEPYSRNDRKADFEDTKKFDSYTSSYKKPDTNAPIPKKEEPKKEEPKKVEPPKVESTYKYEPKKNDPPPAKKEEPKPEPKVEVKKEEPYKYEPKKFEPPVAKKEEPKPEPKKEEIKKTETKPYSSSWNQPKNDFSKSPNSDDIVDAVDEINKQLQEESVDTFKNKNQPKITSLNSKPDPIKPKSNFWEDEEEEDIEDIKPIPKKVEPKKEEPKKEEPKKEEPKKWEPPKKEEFKPEPKKEEPKKQNSGFWDEIGDDDDEEDKVDTKPVSKLEPIGQKKPDPFKKPELPPVEKKVEPPKKKAWEEEIDEDFDDVQLTSGSRQPSAKAADTKALISPVSNTGSNVKDPLGSVFEKLESKKEEPKKKADDDEIDEYIDDFEQSSPDKGLESADKILESAGKDDKKINLAPVQDFKKKIEEPAKADSKESIKSDDAKPVAADDDDKYDHIVTADRLTLTNEYIEQEATIFGQPMNPEVFNNTQVLVTLLQEFIATHKIFIFDYPETEMILNEIGDDFTAFKRTKFPSDALDEIADAMKKYYLEVLSNQENVEAKGRFYIPFATDEPSLPHLIQIDFTNKVFCLIYANPVPADKATTTYATEFHALLRDIVAKMLSPTDARALNNFRLVKVGCTANCEAVAKSVSQQVYLRVMLFVYYLDYELNRKVEAGPIDFDDNCLMRFFCSLKSACTLKEVAESDIWPQYSENFIKTSEQLSDGKEVLVDKRNYELNGTEYDKLSNLIGKELGLLFTKVSKGLKELYLAIDVNQGEMRKSVYYVYMTSTPDPEVTSKKYRALLFLNGENDPEFDNRMDKVMKGLDKTNNTDVILYKDYIRHIWAQQFTDVTLGVWILLVKQNQFSPEEAMGLITYNLNPYHLDMQEEGDGEGGDEYGYPGQGEYDGEGGDGEYYDDDNLPIDEIEDN